MTRNNFCLTYGSYNTSCTCGIHHDDTWPRVTRPGLRYPYTTHNTSRSIDPLTSACYRCRVPRNRGGRKTFASDHRSSRFARKRWSTRLLIKAALGESTFNNKSCSLCTCVVFTVPSSATFRRKPVQEIKREQRETNRNNQSSVCKVCARLFVDSTTRPVFRL